MKKIFLFLVTIVIAAGCMFSISKASDAVKDYLDKYKNQDAEVLVELDELVKEENLTESQQELYKEVMKKQYSDLKYDIVSEEYNGDEAIVTTKITVYDLFFAEQDAMDYQSSHKQEFTKDNGLYDSEKFLDYQLNQMKKTDKRVDYTIDFKVTKKDGKWVLNDLTTEQLEKIHGIYNYTND